MAPQARGTVLFTGASASLRGKPPFAAFASAEAGLRAIAQSMAREFGPQGVHVAHVIVDGGIAGARFCSAPWRGVVAMLTAGGTSMIRSGTGAGIGVLLVIVLAHTASAQLVLGEALGRVDVMCMSTQGPLGSFPDPGFYSCEEHPASTAEMGTTRATASTAFDDLLLVSVSTDCVNCPFAPSTRSSSRISVELAVVQQATPPRPLAVVPVRITTEGRVGVSTLGFNAGGGTYLASTLNVIFTQGDLFAHTMQTKPVTGAVLEDSYAITETVEVTPGETYFGNVYAGCNQSASVPGDWACSGHASVRFELDQVAFELSQGAQSFDLSQFFAIERSPNLVPEPRADLLGAASLGALGLTRAARRAGRESRAAILPA